MRQVQRRVSDRKGREMILVKMWECSDVMLMSGCDPIAPVYLEAMNVEFEHAQREERPQGEWKILCHT